MQWTKAKARAESLLAPTVARRVALRVTGYRAAHDEEGRGWITVDGEEAWNFCTLRYFVERHKLEQGIREANQATNYRDPEQRGAYHEATERAEIILERRGVMGRWYFQRAVEGYPEFGVEEALRSENLVHRALAVLHRRLGRRRLPKLELRPDEHPLVVGLYRFRCSAEGILLGAARGRTRLSGPLRQGYLDPSVKGNSEACSLGR
jgi:hypothetical protein